MADPETLPQVQTPPVPAPEPPNTIFRGPNGIRAGWRIAIFLLLVAGIGLIVALPFVVRRLLRGNTPNAGAQIADGLTPLALAISEGALFVIPSIAALIMACIERRKYGQYGLPARFAFGKIFGSARSPDFSQSVRVWPESSRCMVSA